MLVGTAPFTGLGDLVGTSERWVAYAAALLGLIGVLMVIVAASAPLRVVGERDGGMSHLEGRPAEWRPPLLTKAASP